MTPSWSHHTAPALEDTVCMYCVLLIAQKAQQNRRGQIRGDEIRDRNFCKLWVEKGWAEKHRQEEGRQTDRDVQKKGEEGRREKSDNPAKTTGVEEGNEQKQTFIFQLKSSFNILAM